MSTRAGAPGDVPAAPPHLPTAPDFAGCLTQARQTPPPPVAPQPAADGPTAQSGTDGPTAQPTSAPSPPDAAAADASRNAPADGESDAMSTAAMGSPASAHRPSGHALLSALSHRLYDAGRHLAAWLARPRVRLVVVGVILLLVGALVVTSSVWTLPLVVVGTVMVLVAWVGSRLDGHFALEWGERGTELQFRARIRPPAPVRPALPAASAVASAADTVARAASGPADGVTAAGHAASVAAAAAEAETAAADHDVVEGEAHTVEIDVSELKALIAAAEAEQAGGDVAKAALRLVSERDAS